jgi:hypothetical protein
MAFTTAEVNTWFQTIDGLPATTAPIPTNLSTAYTAELNAGTASPAQIQANLENFPVNPLPPPPNIATDTFYRTSVAQFVLREFQAAWGAVPNSTQFDAWVQRVIADPADVEGGGGMSLALAGTPEFLNEYGLSSSTQLATTGFINQLSANLGVVPGAGAFLNVGLPVWEVLQNFATSPKVIASLETPIASFQNLLLAGGTFPTGSILTLGPGGALNLTTGIDTPTAGFSGGHGATATAAGATFVAAPGTNVLGLSNTLNAGDDLVATGAALGDSTLNYTAVDSVAGNPADAVGVTMSGVNAAVVTVLAAGGALVSGTITGLTAATLAAGSVGDVQFGAPGNGLNTALATVNVNAAHDLTATMTAAALAAAPTGVVNVNGGVVGAGATLDVDGAAIGYASLTVHSAGPGGTTTNDLALNTNATNTATITIDPTSTEALTISGTALNIDNLHTFTGTGTTVGLNVTFTNPDGLGHVDATGGSGVNTFTFDDVTLGATAGDASFTSASTVDGGTGTTNTLGIQADTGAILLTGVGPNITDIQTIVHTTDAAGQTGALTADLALAGSATTFDLAGDYMLEGVTVTDITNAMTVEYSGSGAELTLVHATPGAGQFINFTMDQTATGGTLDLPELTVAAQTPALNEVNLDSTGSAATNEIFNIIGVAANITVTGGTPLLLGNEGNPYEFTGASTTGGGAVIDASADTGGVDVWLGEEFTPNFPNPTQTFIAGTGENTANLLNYEATVVDFSHGGTDTVNFTQPRDSGLGLLSNNPAVDGSPELYNSVVGWTTALDTIHITNGGLMNDLNFTNGGLVPAGATTAILNFTTGSTENASAVADNWIKINTPTTTTGATANAGFDSAIGAAGVITTSAPATSYLASFYDSTNGQAVFVTTASNATDHITNANTVDVIGLIHMSAADYAALGTSSVHFA